MIAVKTFHVVGNLEVTIFFLYKHFFIRTSVGAENVKMLKHTRVRRLRRIMG